MQHTAAIAPTSRVANKVRYQAGPERNAEQGADGDIIGHTARRHDYQQRDHWQWKPQLRCEHVQEHDYQAVLCEQLDDELQKSASS